MADAHRTPEDPRGEDVTIPRTRPPRLRRGAIERKRILAAVSGAGAGQVCLVAPAGFGKSTAMRQIVDSDPRPVAWLALHPADDDVVVLVHHLVASLASSADVTDILRRLEAGLVSGPALAVKGALDAIGALSEEVSGGLQFAIDDLHRVSAPASLDLLDQLTDTISAGSRMVVTSRDTAGMDLARRVAAGDTTVIGAEMLRFSPAEARTAVRGIADLPAPVVEQVCELAEGWPAGTVLAATAAAATGTAPVPEAPLAGFDALAHYVHSEVLDTLSAEEREVVVSASVLDELCGPLCDHLVDGTGSAALLRRLVDSGNPLVVAVGRDSGRPNEAVEWFRFHHLAADHLRDELAPLPPEEVRELHRRAVEWLGTHGLREPAVDHALASGDLDLAARALVAAIPTVVTTGRIDTLQRWLESIPPENLRMSPGLALGAGWRDFLTGHADRVPLWLEHAEAVPSVPTTEPTAAAEALALEVDALALVASVGGLASTAERARRIVVRGPSAGIWYGPAVLLESVARFCMGTLTDRRAAFSRAVFENESNATGRVVSLAHLAHAVLDEADTGAASRTIDAAVAEMDDGSLGDFALVAMTHAVDSLVAAACGDRPRSRRAQLRCFDALETFVGAMPRANSHIRLVLTEAAVRRGDMAEAAAQLQRAEDHLAAEPDAAGLRRWSNELRSRVGAGGGVKLAGGVAITPAEQRVLEQLPTHLTLPEIGDQLFVSRNTVKSHAISIYRKLGVSGRRAAVERSRELGLLDR